VNLYHEPDWLYQSGGITLLGAVLIFAIVFLWTWRKEAKRAGMGDAASETPTPRQSEEALKRRWLPIALTIIGLLILPQVVGSFPSEIIGVVGLYVLLALGLNIVVGYAGMLDLGYVAFYAIGAYTVGILTSPASPGFVPAASPGAAVSAVTATATGPAACVVAPPRFRLLGDSSAVQLPQPRSRGVAGSNSGPRHFEAAP
jgi:branched-chain amino acid transport system permease protein